MQIPDYYRRHATLPILLLAWFVYPIAAQTSDLAGVVQDAPDSSESLPRNEISATARGGIVTLSGRVERLATKRRAVDIAKHVRGVRSIVNQILVQPRELDDETIAGCVRRALVVDPVTEKVEIAVAVEDGEVGIAGRVSSLAEKQIAETAVSEVHGVRNIVNQLTVGLIANRPAAELQAEIAALIEHSTPLSDSRIAVSVAGRTATLTGAVGAAWQIDTLRFLAGLPGIESVSLDDVQVDPAIADEQLRSTRQAKVTDESMQQAIGRAIRFDPLVASYVDDVEIQVTDGHVTLAGTVGRVRAKRGAVQITKNTLGVRRVTDELKVAWTGENVDDATIIREAQAAIQRSSYLQGHEVRVHCHNAHLHLYGIVDSQFEKQLATWTCDGLKGVVHVANMLAVTPSDRARVSDVEIKAALEKKLKQSLIAPDHPIDVSVKNGVAILRGEVDTWQQWQAALNLALESGAQSPHSLIRVRNHPSHNNGKSVFVP